MGDPEDEDSQASCVCLGIRPPPPKRQRHRSGDGIDGIDGIDGALGLSYPHSGSNGSDPIIPNTMLGINDINGINGINDDNADNDSSDDDLECIIVEDPSSLYPSSGQSMLPSSNPATGSTAEDADADVGIDDLYPLASQVEVTKSTMTNPNIDYIHKRPDCGVHSFDDDPKLHCAKCYCVVCDKPASQCQTWEEHCKEKPKTQKTEHWDEVELLDAINMSMQQMSQARQSQHRQHQLQQQQHRQRQQWHVQANQKQPPRHSAPQEAGMVRIRSRPSTKSRGGSHDSALPNPVDEFSNQRSNNEGPPLPHKSRSKRQPAQKKIMEIFDENLALLVKGDDNDPSTKKNQPAEVLPTDGDIDSLKIHKSLVMNRIQIGWPYPKMMQPQRQMAIHILKGLKTKKHVVLESPTGTGKSAAILCTVLAWQRHFFQVERKEIAKKLRAQKQARASRDAEATQMDITANGKPAGDTAASFQAVTDREPELPSIQEHADTAASPNTSKPRPQGSPAVSSPGTQETARRQQFGDSDKDVTERLNPVIIYCSRTHSQVAQMVSSLRKTPYRPRMTVMGSRDRLCINRDLKNGNKKGQELTQACVGRKNRTESDRKEIWKNKQLLYDDDNPRAGSIIRAEHSVNRDMYDTDEVGYTGSGQRAPPSYEDDAEDAADRKSGSKDGPTCSHFRQLTSKRTAELVRSRFAMEVEKISCCSLGGEKSKVGVHDIEDLVTFGKNPYLEKDIAFYRDGGKLGITMSFDVDKKTCVVEKVQPQGAVQKNSVYVEPGDVIIGVNGTNTTGWSLDQTKAKILNTKKDPLTLTILRKQADTTAQLGNGEAVNSIQNQSAPNSIDLSEAYSDHAPCPYYVSRGLIPHAELIFAPYNYLLDPVIRKRSAVSLPGNVVVLDEAHNIEDLLCESGSGEFGEIELCGLVRFLSFHANKASAGRAFVTGIRNAGPGQNELDGQDTAKQDGMKQSAHTLLVFVEKVVWHMRGLRKKFQGSAQRQKALNLHQERRLPDNHSEEVAFCGPTGIGVNGRAIGCMPFMTELGVTPQIVTGLQRDLSIIALELASYSGKEDAGVNNTVEMLSKLISRFDLAVKNPQHYYMLYEMKATVNMDYACMSEAEWVAHNRKPHRGKRQTKYQGKSLRQIPFISPRTEANPTRVVPICELCKRKNPTQAAVAHGLFCDGSRPQWESRLVFRLLSPGILMRPLAAQCRSVILASGSLAPIPSLCAELDLIRHHRRGAAPGVQTATPQYAQRAGAPGGRDERTMSSPARRAGAAVPNGVKHESGVANGLPASPPHTNAQRENWLHRLQLTPPPLEANHVIDKHNQLLAVGVGHFPDGSRLAFTYSNYRQPGYYERLGQSIATIIESIPRGGVLIFLPSYSVLKQCVRCWNPNEPGFENNRFDGYSNRNRFRRRNGNSQYNRRATGLSNVWGRFQDAKRCVIVEPTGSQDDFEKSRDEYSRSIEQTGECILLAVYRGKMSEGISFNDDYARCVICVGIPYPNRNDRSISAKQAYNNEQRNVCKNLALLSGSQWYAQQAYRAVAQALGRCIRHGADYGAIILLDHRFCDDGSPNGGICSQHQALPKWMRSSIRTLSPRQNFGQGANPIVGGYAGLRKAIAAFFDRAPRHCKKIRDQWESDQSGSTQPASRPTPNGGEHGIVATATSAVAAAAAATAISTTVATETASPGPGSSQPAVDGRRASSQAAAIEKMMAATARVIAARPAGSPNSIAALVDARIRPPAITQVGGDETNAPSTPVSMPASMTTPETNRKKIFNPYAKGP